MEETVDKHKYFLSEKLNYFHCFLGSPLASDQLKLRVYLDLTSWQLFISLVCEMTCLAADKLTKKTRILYEKYILHATAAADVLHPVITFKQH